MCAVHYHIAAASLLLCHSSQCEHDGAVQVTFTFKNAALRAGTNLWLCQTVFATATVSAASGSDTSAPALGQVTTTAEAASEVQILCAA